MGVITFENMVGGWVSTPSGAVATTVPLEGREDQYSYSTGIEFFRAGFEGQIAPGEVFQDMVSGGVGTSVVNSLPLNGIVTSSGEVFVVLASSRLIQFSASDDVISSSYDIGTNVISGGGTDFVTDNNFVDVVTFNSGSGTEWVAWTWEGAGNQDADIARAIAPTGVDAGLTSPTDAWFSGLTGSGKLTRGVPHILHIGPDKILYCTNGRAIASHDPSTTSGATNVFDLGSGWEANGMENIGNYIGIIAQKIFSAGTSSANETRVYLWDGIKPTADFIYDLQDYRVTAIKVYDGVPLVWTQGRNNMTRIKALLGGNKVITVFENGNIANSPRPRSVEIFRNLVIWGQDSANFVISALKHLGNLNFGHHQIMYPHDANLTISAMGMIKQLTANFLYAGVATSSTQRLLRINNSTYYRATADFTTRLVKLPYLSKITKIKFHLSQFGTGASFTASLFENRDAMSVGGADDLLNRQFTSATWGTGIDEISVPVYIPNLSSFYMNIRFDHAAVTNTAAIIKKIEVEYEPTRSV